MEFEKLDDGRITCPFDHHSKEFAENYLSILDELRVQSPLVWSDLYGGFWVATGYSTVRKLMVNSSAVTVDHGPNHQGGIFIPARPNAENRPLFVPGEVEGQEHDKYRLALNSHFSKARVAERAPMIERHVDAAIDRIIDLGEFDVVGDFIGPILAGVACEILGLEVDNPKQFFRDITHVVDFEERDGLGEVVSTFRYAWDTVVNTIAERRVNPRDDVISALTQWEAVHFTDEQIQMMVLNVILGAGDTTSAMMGQAMMYLHQHRDVCDHLASHPEDVRAAVEEFLRLFAVAMGPARTMTQDVEIEGVILKKGDRLLPSLPGANHDPEQFPEPYSINLERGSGRHLAMGVGTHFCLGSHLAKAISERAIQKFLKNIPTFTVDIDSAVSNPDKSSLNGWERIPARVG